MLELDGDTLGKVSDLITNLATQTEDRVILRTQLDEAFRDRGADAVEKKKLLLMLLEVDDVKVGSCDFSDC